MILIRNFKVHYWPGLTTIWLILTLITSYSISVLNGHVKEILPFISDTGANPPESCVLAQMMNIGAVLMAVTMYIRYRQVDIAISSKDIAISTKWNNVAFWSGNITCLGVSMVGNFQKNNFISAHFIGAFLCFGVATVYLVIQTKISFSCRTFYNKNPEYGIGSFIVYYRLFLMSFYILIFVVTVASGVVSMKLARENGLTSWTQEADGYDIHLVAAISEWLMVLVFVGYTLTGTNEFKTIEYKQIIFKRKRLSLQT